MRILRLSDLDQTVESLANTEVGIKVIAPMKCSDHGIQNQPASLCTIGAPRGSRLPRSPIAPLAVGLYLVRNVSLNILHILTLILHSLLCAFPGVYGDSTTSPRGEFCQTRATYMLGRTVLQPATS